MRWIGGIAAALAVVGAMAVVRARASPAIDGVACQTDGSMALALHIHQHLALYDRGRPVPVPAGIGTGMAAFNAPCLYELHVHRADGLISVETPRRRSYTLGQFFAVWGQPLSRRRLASQWVDAPHEVRAYIDGRIYRGDPRRIRLAEHERITLEVGPPWVAPPPYTFPAGT
jgi:hypothetical protein